MWLESGRLPSTDTLRSGRGGPDVEGFSAVVLKKDLGLYLTGDMLFDVLLVVSVLDTVRLDTTGC